MKLSFSTLGCPNWALSEILSAAKDLGFQGIELRGLGQDIRLHSAPAFQPSNLEHIKSELASKNLAIPCIATECELQKQDPNMVINLMRYIVLAEKLNCPYLRVLGDTNPWPGENVDISLVEHQLALLAAEAKDFGVTLLLESNGVFADTARLRQVLEEVDSPHVGALWDINHPVRYFNESPKTTYENIGKYIRHVHVKDSVQEGDMVKYKMMGHGDLPITEAFGLLKANDYSGYLSLEWTKRWNSELEEPGIVFSHFAYAAKNFWNNA